MDIESALSNLIDDRDFIEINKQRARFNLFEAMGTHRRELSHSNFLAFLLSPARSHGLGSRPLQQVLRALLAKIPPDKRPIPALEVAVGDIDDATIFREVDYIDLLIEVAELKFLVVIENKIDAKAGEGQLERYKAVVDKKYPDWRKLFVFLTPDGRDPDHPSYISFGYGDLIKIIESLIEDGSHTYGQDVLLILKHYIEMIRRNIVEDDALRALALKVYERYADAIDFIVKCRPEGTSLLPIAQALVEKDLNLELDSHTATIYRFYPKKWLGVAALNRCPRDKWSKSGRNILFEIKSFKSEGEFSDRLLLSLILGPSEPPLRQYIFDGARRKQDVFVNTGKAIGQSWVTVFSRELLSAAAAENMDETGKEETITQNWNDFAVRELPRLTDEMLTLASSAPV